MCKYMHVCMCQNESMSMLATEIKGGRRRSVYVGVCTVSTHFILDKLTLNSTNHSGIYKQKSALHTITIKCIYVPTCIMISNNHHTYLCMWVFLYISCSIRLHDCTFPSEKFKQSTVDSSGHAGRVFDILPKFEEIALFVYLLN